MKKDIPNRRIRRNLLKHSIQEKIVLGIATPIFIIYSITLIYPFVWAFLAALKGARDLNRNYYGLPKEWIFENFATAFTTKLTKNGISYNILGLFFNSLWSSFVCAFCGVFVSCMTAYVVTKYRFFGSKLFLPIAIILQALPLVGSMPAMVAVAKFEPLRAIAEWMQIYDLQFTVGNNLTIKVSEIVNRFKLYDNPFLFWIVWCGGFGYSFVILCGYFKGVSWEYAEAAFIDGASHTAVFFKIMLPLAFPAIFSLFLVSFISAWNDYYTMLLYMPSYPTLAVGVYTWEKIAAQGGGDPIYMAAVLISVIPTLILYASFQKVILGASLSGGIKE